MWAVCATGSIAWFIKEDSTYDDSDAYYEGYKYCACVIIYFVQRTAAAPAWAMLLPSTFQLLMWFPPHASVPLCLWTVLSFVATFGVNAVTLHDQRLAFEREVRAADCGFGCTSSFIVTGATVQGRQASDPFLRNRAATASNGTRGRNEQRQFSTAPGS